MVRRQWLQSDVFTLQTEVGCHRSYRSASTAARRQTHARFARGADEGVRPYTSRAAARTEYYGLCLITVTLLYATRNPSRSALRCEVVAPCVTTTAYSHPASIAARMRACSKAVCRPRPRKSLSVPAPQ